MGAARTWGAVMVENDNIVDARIYATEAARTNAANEWTRGPGRHVVAMKRGTSQRRGGSWLPEERLYEGGGEQVSFPLTKTARAATRRAYEPSLVTVASGGRLVRHNELRTNTCRQTKAGVTCNVDGRNRRFRLS
jgi:hypothetical protein